MTPIPIPNFACFFTMGAPTITEPQQPWPLPPTPLFQSQILPQPYHPQWPDSPDAGQSQGQPQNYLPSRELPYVEPTVTTCSAGRSPRSPAAFLYRPALNNAARNRSTAPST